MSSNTFEKKTILVVGAGSRDGIGYATAEMLAAKGAQVALADIADSKVTALAASLVNAQRHSAHIIDITDAASVAKVVDSVCDRYGRIDGAVITAGIYARESFLETTPEVWQKVFSINAFGTFQVAQAVARKMMEGGGGRIVNVASIGGRAPQLTAAAYGASKAAVIQLTRYIALELATHGITVNVLCPGSTATSMMGTDKVRHDAAINGDLAQWRLGIPLGHMAEAADQAAAIAFLLGDGARHMTGQVITVDGGQTFL